MKIRKIVKLLISNPRKYVPLSFKLLQQPLCYIFQKTAFFMQGQMDINPKSRWYKAEFTEQTGGYFPQKDGTQRIISDLEPWDTTRRDMLILLLRTIIEKEINGDFVEVGVYKGLTAKLIHYYAPERSMHLFDTFEGFGKRSVSKEKVMSGHIIVESHFADTSLDEVKKNMSLITNNVFFHKGYFPDSIPDDLKDHKFAFVHLDADLYEPIYCGLNFFYPRMSRGGFIVIHDYNAWHGARKAVDEFLSDKGKIAIPMPDKSGSALIQKQ